MSIANFFESGTIVTKELFHSSELIAWMPHPVYKGVYIKKLVSGDQTGGALNTMLVKVEQGCSIGSHTHPTQLELHQVLQGEGTLVLGQREAPYKAGTMGVIPIGETHSVSATHEDLYILAVFTPSA